MKYPAIFEPAEEGGYVVQFRDIPEAFTQGDTRQEAEAMAKDVLLFVLEDYFDDRKAVPMPSTPQAGDVLIELPAIVTAKVLLLNTMIGMNIRPADLARKMAVRPQTMTNLLNLNHSTKIDTVADAFKALGKTLELQVR